MKVAIIGATSHIAKNLIYQNSKEYRWDLYLFARNLGKLDNFIKENLSGNCKNIYLVDEFLTNSDKFDAVINCVGFGTPDKVKKAGVDLFNITESIDNMIIEYLQRNLKTVYVNFSSGAVYGTNMDKPVDKGYHSVIGIQPLGENEYYRIAKINSEAKHRSLKDFNIIDLRLFSFFSRFIDLNGRFLLTEIVESLKNCKLFKTSKNEIFRDYISPSDLFNLVNACVISEKINVAIDTYSKEPVSKSLLLKELSNELGLVIEYIEDIKSSPTGLKAYYYSNNKNAFEILGYKPEKGSLETLCEEINFLVN